MATGTAGIGGQASIPGAAVSVASETSLGQLDIGGLTLGTEVYVQSTDTRWTLKISTAAIVDGVVAVLGVTGMRWIRQGDFGTFVTFGDLSSTAVDSGATLIGVNANGGMFSEPDLQGVLQEDVVLKVPLAAVDGTGGASIVGIQDAGGYFTGTTVEAALAQIGAAGIQTIANPTEFTLSTGNVLSALLSDAATNAASAMRTWEHQTSGTAAASFGSKQLDRLENASGTMKDAVSMAIQWVTATNAVEDAKLTFTAMRGGTLTDLASMSGANASGNYPFAIPVSNTDEAAMAFTKSGNQDIVKVTAGNLAIRARNATGAAVALSGSTYPCFQAVQRAGYVDAVVGPQANLGLADANGYLFVPTITTAAGAPTQAPEALPTGTTATVFNRFDSTQYAYINGTGWKGVTLTTPLSVGATLTNNVTAGGTTDVIDNWTSLTVYTTDAAAIRNAVYQLALKVRKLELALKQNVSIAIV